MTIRATWTSDDDDSTDELTIDVDHERDTVTVTIWHAAHRTSVEMDRVDFAAVARLCGIWTDAPSVTERLARA
jgi:uncharacterized protein YuzE